MFHAHGVGPVLGIGKEPCDCAVVMIGVVPITVGVKVRGAQLADY